MADKGKHRKPGRHGIPAHVVEVEYGATEGAADRSPEAIESVSHMPEVRGISTESQRRKRAVEILAEAVYRYLKRRGKLSAQAGHMAGNAREDWPGSGGKILDESLDFQAQRTGTYDGLENG
jgi:hypothetical protein